MRLQEIVPWGRSADEYVRMFGLANARLASPILDCGGGPSSFNAEMTRAGRRVISCDPIYEFTAEQIDARIQETAPQIIEGARANLQSYVWTEIKSPEDMANRRMAAMRVFLDDYPAGRTEKRYVVESLPTLSFSDQHFDLALCSHLLFTYSDHLSAEFHLSSVLELCRVAREVRIFPVLKLDGRPSAHVSMLVPYLKQRGYFVAIEPVEYEFQKGGNRMLRVRVG
jgi:hypothetical protein